MVPDGRGASTSRAKLIKVRHGLVANPPERGGEPSLPVAAHGSDPGDGDLARRSAGPFGDRDQGIEDGDALREVLAQSGYHEPCSGSDSGAYLSST